MKRYFFIEIIMILSIVCSVKGGLLYRLHHIVHIKLDTCISNYGTISANEEKGEFSYTKCTDKDCNVCDKPHSYNFKENEFLPFQVFENGFGMTVQGIEFSSISAKILGFDKPQQKENDVTILAFQDQASCNISDFSKAVMILFGPPDDISKCFDLSFGVEGELSVMNSCEHKTKELICRSFQGSKTCEGKSTLCGSSCQEQSPLQIYCDLDDFDFFGKGVNLDISLDFYEEEGISEIGEAKTCMKTTISNNKYTRQICSIKSGEDCSGCKEIFHQDFVLGENVAFNLSRSPLPTFSSMQMFAYGNSPLDFEAGKPNVLGGWYDLKLENKMLGAAKGNEIYSFHQYMFEGCMKTKIGDVDYGSKRRCESDGSISQIDYEGLDCSGKIIKEEKIKNSGICGRFLHDHEDIVEPEIKKDQSSSSYIVTWLLFYFVVFGYISCYCGCGCLVILCKSLGAFKKKKKSSSPFHNEWSYDNLIELGMEESDSNEEEEQQQEEEEEVHQELKDILIEKKEENNDLKEQEE